MRTSDEIIQIIITNGKFDSRIRAITLDGSRAISNACLDQYSDYDLSYFVTHLKDFVKQSFFPELFGEVVICHRPDHGSIDTLNPAKDMYRYLIQCADGVNLDIQCMDMMRLNKESKNLYPREVLLNKDNRFELISLTNENLVFEKQPTPEEFFQLCSAIRWHSLTVCKAICRKDFYDARYSYEQLFMRSLTQLMIWKVAASHDFKIKVDSRLRNISAYINDTDWCNFMDLFPSNNLDRMWKCLFEAYDAYIYCGRRLAAELNYPFPEKENRTLRNYLLTMY